MNGSQRVRDLAGLLARLIVGGLFIYSGAIKALSPAEEFAYAIESYRVIGPGLSLWAAYIVPWVELYAGLLLAVGVYTRLSALFIGLMLIFFEVLLAQAWLRGLPITSCGCFGSGGSNSLGREFIQNLGLIGLCWAALLHGRPFSADDYVEKHTG